MVRGRYVSFLHVLLQQFLVADYWTSKSGGIDNGKPGKRQYSRDFYAAFVLDPLGNNIEVLHMLKEKA